MNTQRQPKFDITFFKIVIFFVIPIIIIGFGILFYSLLSVADIIWICVLFLIPVLIQGIGWFFIHRETENIDYEATDETFSSVQIGARKFCVFYNFTMFLSVMFYGLMWGLYIINTKRSLEFSPEFLTALSYLCLIIIFIQFLIAVFMTYVVMENTQKVRWEYMEQLKTGLELFPFWRFAHFFAIFMSIAFLFGFAFAFHDLSFRKPPQKDSSSSESSTGQNGLDSLQKMAIYVENLNSDEESDEKNVRNAAQVENATPSCFYFESGRAEFTAEDRTKDLKSNSSLNDKDNKNKRIAQSREDRNFQETSKLIAQIQQNKTYGIVRITLIGRADDKQSNGVYSSNYDLSEARINMIRNKITEQLYSSNNKTWQSIDWITVPYSNEAPRNAEGKCKTLEMDTDSGRRVVEAYLYIISPDDEMVQTKKLRKKQTDEFNNKYKKMPDLIDYMYFSIYTISTTGYGDIKPATTYSKFLVSLENFFEIFFLVGFMNSLISLRREMKSS
jgi:hypothetical protein